MWDIIFFVVPLLCFALGVAGLLYIWPWPPNTLLNRESKPVKILDIVEVSPDTKRFRLSLGEKGNVLGLPTGKHIIITAPNSESCLSSGKWNDKSDADKGRKEISRHYTPITGDEAVGYFDIMVKIYRPGKTRMADDTEVNWSDGGKMGQYLASKVPGDYIEITGPVGTMEYLGRGTFKLPDRTVSVKHVGMLAGGTGITPMLQVLRAALKDKGDSCRFTLIYANKTEDDILMRETLESLVEQGKGQLNIVYTLDFPPPKWKHYQGFIDAGTIRQNIPAPRKKPGVIEPLILMCGPPPMMDGCKKHLETLGYPKASWVTF